MIWNCQSLIPRQQRHRLELKDPVSSNIGLGRARPACLAQSQAPTLVHTGHWHDCSAGWAVDRQHVCYDIEDILTDTSELELLVCLNKWVTKL